MLPSKLRSLCGASVDHAIYQVFEQRFHIVCDLLDVSLCSFPPPLPVWPVSRSIALALALLPPFFSETPQQLAPDVRYTMLNATLR